jgi:hypothetical protein
MKILNAKTGSGRAKPPKFSPSDFAGVISHLPDGCPLVGGQAVAWWARKYGITGKGDEPVTSGDIDFWGGREDLLEMARGMRRKPIFPNEHEMTVWVGAIQIRISGEETLAEFLHFIPGLDTPYPEKAAVEQTYREPSIEKVIQVLTPVSLVLTKLHALRRFDQKERNDELHLKVSLRASREFIAELLAEQEARRALRECERLIAAHQSKPYRKLEQQSQFNLLDSIPIAEIQQAADSPVQSPDNRQRLRNFINLRWHRVVGTDPPADSPGRSGGDHHCRQ